VLRTAARIALLLSLGLAHAACGYRLAAGDLKDVGSVAVVTPKNETAEPGIEFVVADVLRRELLRRSDAQLAEKPESAGVVVRGRVVRLETSTRAFSSVVLALEYEAVLELELRADRDGEALVAPVTLQDSERYLASSDVEAQRRNRDEAVRRVASVLASRFIDRVGDRAAAQ
jgi:hypothetical protein